MSGYNVAGIPLAVTVSSSSEFPRVTRQGRQTDNRRNLYVLGLPFDLTKAELVEIFSRYGTVSHAVILATVDNASRRRGFIVMSNHSEARAAMDALGRNEIKGHTIDVSWAVVQRSQGFLDGGDRTSVLASHSPSPSPSPFDFGPVIPTASSNHVSASSTPLPDRIPASVLSAQTASIMVSNLPAVLFSQLADLEPLFRPYGDIKKIDVLESSRTDLNQGNIAVIVEYASAAQAKDARDALHGQAYSSSPVKVDFMQNHTNIGYEAQSILSEGKDSKTSLNPRAAPFIAPTQDNYYATVTPMYTQNALLDQKHLTAALPTGLLAVNPYSQYATPSASMYTHLCVPAVGTMRPNSAPSPWSDQSQTIPPKHWALPQLQHFPNLSTPSLGQTYAA